MNTEEVTSYIVDNNLIKEVLEKIGCHSFIEGKDLRCALPNDNDSSKVSINKEMYVRIFTKGESIRGNIFNLIMYIDSCPFIDAFNKCCFILNLDNNYKATKKKSSNIDFYKKIKICKDYIPTQIYYDLSILNRYILIPHIDLIKRDGIISQKHLTKYHIMFDERTDRIVFPHFKYDNSKVIAGIVGRTVNKAFEELKISKYLSLLDTTFKKELNLYAMSLNISYIKEKRIALVFEAEKSCIKADMFGYPIGVAVGSHEVSPFQRRLLIGLDAEICIAFDKDVEKQHILNICKELYPYRKVTYIIDTWNLLNAKDSPVDRGHRKWEFLFKNRIVYKGE